MRAWLCRHTHHWWGMAWADVEHEGSRWRWVCANDGDVVDEVVTGGNGTH